MCLYCGEKHSKGEKRMSLEQRKTTSIVPMGVCGGRRCLEFTVLTLDEGCYQGISKVMASQSTDNFAE